MNSFTVGQSVGIVFSNSSRVMVNPTACQTQGEGVQVKGSETRTVDLVMVLHVQERILVDHAVEVDVWLDAPVVFVLLQERVAEEEPGVEAAHVAIRHAPCISSVQESRQRSPRHAPP